MQKYRDTVLSSIGRPVGGASVQVSLYPSGTTAVIYSGNGVGVIANPITADSNGSFAFYAADGRYTLTISGTGVVSASITDILLEDPADGFAASATYATTAGSATTAGTVTTPAQLAITSVSTLTSLTVSGAATVGAGLAVTGAISATGTVNFGAGALITDVSGRVGLGVASPVTRLEIALTGTTNLATTTVVKSTDFAATSRAGFSGLSNNNDGIYFGMGADGAGIPAGMGYIREGTGWKTALSFYTNSITAGPDSTSAMQEKMRITSGGNVGIGTSSPGATLDVIGGIRTSATIATGGYTVATLPAGTIGQLAYVTDALAPTYNAAVVGGGTVVVPVFRNATIWVTA